MVYMELLPKTDSLMHLAEVAGPFPASRKDIMLTARSYGFNKDVLHFLSLFPADEIFESRADFIARSEEVELLIREERNTPDEEAPLSPQD